MNLFKTTRWTPEDNGVSTGYSKYFVCIDDNDESEMHKWLISKNMKYEVKNIDINSVDSISDLRGLSLKDFKKLLDNM